MKRISLVYPLAFTVALLLGLQALVSAAPAGADTIREDQAQEILIIDQRDAVARAISWLVRTHQNDDGGYTSFSTGANVSASDIGGTLDAIMALSSAGYNPAALASGQESSPIDYLRQSSVQLADYAAVDGAQAGKVVLALVAANQNPRRFEGVDYVAVLLDHLDFAGQFNVDNSFNQSLAILAMSAANEPVPEAAVRWLLDQQAQDEEIAGSWSDGFGTVGNADATAMSIMALASTKLTITNDSLVSAADFLWRTQLEGGGWEYGAGFGANVNSTALVIQALSALELDFFTPDANGMSPLATLFSWQGESGAFQADFGDGPFDDFFSTVQALPAAAGKAFPLPGRHQAGLKAAGCLATLQDPTTGGWEQFAGSGVDAAGTARAILAITALGEDPASARWTSNGTSALQALEDLAEEHLSISRGGGIGILMQAVVASGGDVNEFAGTDLVMEMNGHLSPTGEYDDTTFGPFAQAEAMMGLLAAGVDVDPTAIDWLLGAHNNGDWGGADSTGIALNVLGQLGLQVPEAIEVLHQTQEADGGWGFGLANPNSTSEVAQGLAAVGENPFEPNWSQIVSGTLANAADVIIAQQAENGCWPNLFGPGDDPFGTTDAILLLVLQPGWGRTVSSHAVSANSGETATTTDVTSTQVLETPVPTLAPTEPVPPTEIPESTEILAETPEAEAIADVENQVEGQTDAQASETTIEETTESDSNRLIIAVLLAAAALALIAGLLFRSRRAS